ncbi:DUF4097 family beta strand repeat protein [Alicyclobacillus curvatus]|jgi:DUF4097 and DUF4098 domain-containing protein YvlB|nr:DUF4097 family beta strand repeat protein [Alicyclobacillus curvatus]
MLKKIALAAAGVLLIGIGGMVATAAIQHDTISQYMSSLVRTNVNLSDTHGGYSFDQTKTLDGASVQSLQVTADAASVYIHPGSSNQIVVHAYGSLVGIKPSDFTLDVTQQGNQVIVNLLKHNVFSFGLNSIRLKVDVEVPKHLYDSVNARASAGNVTVQNLSAKNLTLRSNAGSVNASQVTGSVKASSSAGSVQIHDITGDVNLESNAGSIQAGSIDGTIHATSSAGSITINLPAITHNITAKSTAGQVRITTATAPPALQFTLQTSAGRINFNLPNATFHVNQSSDVEGSIGTGGPVMNLSASAGSIQVSEGPVS